MRSYAPDSLTAFAAIAEEAFTWRLISATELDSSSVAPATDCTLVDASSEAAATAVACCSVFSAVVVIDAAVLAISVAAEATVLTTAPTLDWNASASCCIAWRFPSRAATSSEMSWR